MPGRLISTAVAPYLDVPRDWPSNADALDAHVKALDAVEAEFRSPRRLLLGAAGLLTLIAALAALGLGLFAVADTEIRTSDRVTYGPTGLIVGGALGWFGARLALRAYRAGRKTLDALTYWYQLPTTLTEDGGPIPLEHLSRANIVGALDVPKQPKPFARNVVITVSLALALLLLMIGVGGVVVAENAPQVGIGAAFLAMSIVIGAAVGIMWRSSARAKRLREVLVFFPDELLDEIHEMPEDLRTFATAVHTASKHAGMTPPPIRVGRAKGEFGGMAYESKDGRQIIIQNTLIAAPPSVQEFVAAHEVAHLELNHTRLPKKEQLRLGLVGLGTLVLVLTAFALPILLPIHAVVGGIAAMIVVVASRFVAAAIFAPNQRRREIAADERAFEYGYPLTSELVAWFKEYDPSEKQRRLRTHPTWNERLAATR